MDPVAVALWSDLGPATAPEPWACCWQGKASRSSPVQGLLVMYLPGLTFHNNSCGSFISWGKNRFFMFCKNAAHSRQGTELVGEKVSCPWWGSGFPASEAKVPVAGGGSEGCLAMGVS